MSAPFSVGVLTVVSLLVEVRLLMALGVLVAVGVVVPVCAFEFGLVVWVIGRYLRWGLGIRLGRRVLWEW